MALMLPLAVSAQAVLPDAIPLPPGWQPEGIAKGTGTTMFSATSSPSTSSPATAASLSTRRSGAPPPASSRTGGDARGLRAGRRAGPTGRSYVYALDGAPGDHVLARPAATFVIDVVMTGDGVVHRLVR